MTSPARLYACGYGDSHARAAAGQAAQAGDPARPGPPGPAHQPELAEPYPDAHCELNFASPLELLVATILSAQTTDAGQPGHAGAFARYRLRRRLRRGRPGRHGDDPAVDGFFRAKTKPHRPVGQALCDRYGGEVPRRLEDLVTLPGVGRKTANVVLGNAFGVPGITVDTHFSRLSRRFGWTAPTDPVKIEQEVGGSSRGRSGPCCRTG